MVVGKLFPFVVLQKPGCSLRKKKVAPNDEGSKKEKLILISLLLGFFSRSLLQDRGSEARRSLYNNFLTSFISYRLSRAAA
jgi:hypothetical protein